MRITSNLRKLFITCFIYLCRRSCCDVSNIIFWAITLNLVDIGSECETNPMVEAERDKKFQLL